MSNKERKLGNLWGYTGGNYAGNVYDKDYICPTILTMQGGLKQPMIIDVICVSSRGRDPNNPSDRTSGNPNLEQRLEINECDTTNTITSVCKDNYILEIYNYD